MRWLALSALIAVVALSGCGNRRDAGAESSDAGEDIVQADTANIDSGGNAESLPTIDTDVKPSEEPQPQEAQAPRPAEQPEDVAATAPAPNVDAQPAAAPVSGTGQIANYRIQRGDTLMKIAFNVYGDIDQWKTIYALNKDALQSANALVVGSALKYDRPNGEPNIEKNGEPYLIKKGDTLGTIADDVYGKKSKWKKIYENNRSLIKDPNRIYAGFYLYYQITEEEKQEAERVRALRGNQMGSSEKLPDSASNAPMPTPTTGGLSNLAAPPADNVARAPASK